MTDYERIAKAIMFMKEQYKLQPSLDDVARQVHISPHHFQRMFQRWAGVSPKKFLQYLSIEHAKRLLRQDSSLLDASFEAGLSGTGRLHDLFVTIEGMTPGEFKNGGAQLSINYSFAESPFGDIIIASTERGICYLAFADDEKRGWQDLKRLFPRASFQQKVDLLQQNALRVFTNDWSDLERIRLHLKGTPFRLKVWETLLRIPFGRLSTYSAIGKGLHMHGAARAVGSAVAENPVAFLIPCHRVIRATGIVGDYRWGSSRKAAMIGWEAARTFGVNQDSSA